MQGKMKAQVFYEPEVMKLEEVDIPQITDEQILVRVKACGICGSDVAYYFGASSLETPTGKGPLILGHEFTGEVVEVGKIPESLGLFKPGDRVVLDPVQYCNACEVCKKGYVNLCENKTVLGVSVDGGFAEYSVSHYTGVHKLPDNVTYEQGALTEPLADAVYGVENMEISPGDFCVVIGPGPIGIMMVQLAKASGAGRVVLVGTRDYRLQAGLEMGADEAFNIGDKSSPIYTDDLKGEIERLSGGKFADAVIVATGSVEAMEIALEISGRRSRVVYFGLPADVAVVKVPALAQILWDKTIRFSWLAPLTWPRALQLLSTGQVEVERLITHRYKLDQLEEALHEVRERKGNVMKAVVVME
jgi:L-iditol 2-dehydrogenase